MATTIDFIEVAIVITIEIPYANSSIPSSLPPKSQTRFDKR